MLNGECDDAVFFSSLGYQVDVFASEDAAREALFGDIQRDIYESLGFEIQDSFFTYTKQASTCDDAYGVHMVTLYPRGRFLVAIDLLVELDRLGGMPGPSDLLQSLAMQIESAFADIYRPEIR